MSSSVVTRFAPSPTGYLHIGGARTALFNWLYARGRQGKFLLRIEDTDRARHNAAAVDAIIDGLSWLGIDWDGDPVSQYSRRDRHADVANELLARGAAYRCYMSTDEIEAARLKAIETKSRFESPWRDAPTESAPANRQFTIRFRAPRDGETEVHDSVQGDVKFPNSALDDLIILRSDGAPTYNLAVVVDDHDMGVTHVIRGDDHLNNAARQQQIYRALDWALPSFSHVPLIHGPDGAKLSKRHGALGVDAYRDLGFLPEGVCNYLLRLGWSHGDDEIIPREKALAWFDVAGINRAPARLDLAKMAHTNAHYMKLLDDESLVEKSAPFFEKAGVVLNNECRARLVRAAGFLKDRSATLAGVVEAAAFLFLPRPIDISGKAGKPLAKEGAQEHLRDVYEMLKTLPTEPRYPEMPPGVIGLMAPIPPPWADPVALDEKLKSYAEKRGINFGEIGPALRAALTAGLPSPSLGEVLHGLGTAEALGRILDAISL